MTHSPSTPCRSAALTVALLLIAASGASQASDSISGNYTRISPGETVLAPFTASSTPSLQTYAGPVEVQVSGLGYSLGSRVNDAFYFDGGEPTLGFYLLNVGWDGANLVPSVGSSRNAANFITFIDGLGAVAAGTRPAYSASHVYRFVIDVPTNAGALQFGVSDGNFADNGGEYTLQLWQLQAGVVPEPAAAGLLLAGLGVLGAMQQRLRRRAAKV